MLIIFHSFVIPFQFIEDECSPKDDISHLIDDTQQTVQLTDLQVLQQLLERELNEASYISSIVNKDQPINAEQSKRNNQHEVSSVNQPIELQHLSSASSMQLQYQSSNIRVNKPELPVSSNLHQTGNTQAINTKHLLLSQYSKFKSIEEAIQLETRIQKVDEIYTTKISKEYSTSHQITHTPVLELKATISPSYKIQPSKSTSEKHLSTSVIQSISPSTSIKLMQTSFLSSQLEPSPTSHKSMEESQMFEKSTPTSSVYSEADTMSPSIDHKGSLSTVFTGRASTINSEILENSSHLQASSEILSTKLPMTSRSESILATEKIKPSVSSSNDLYSTEMRKSLSTKVKSSATVDLHKSSLALSQSKENKITTSLLVDTGSQEVLSTSSPTDKRQFSSKLTAIQSTSITQNDAQPQTSTPMATETETLCSAPLYNLPTTVLVEPSHTASVLEAHESRALKMEKMRMKCDRCK